MSSSADADIVSHLPPSLVNVTSSQVQYYRRRERCQGCSTAPRPTRRDRARATRRRIALAALAAFSANGYAATTMDAVARDAGVAVQTVYFTFHTKAELLVAAIELAGGAPDDPAIVMERAWIGAVMAAPDGPKRLSLIVEHGNEIYARVGPLLPAVSAAASVDPEVESAWHGLEARRRDGMSRIVAIFAERGELRPGLTGRSPTTSSSGSIRRDVPRLHRGMRLVRRPLQGVAVRDARTPAAWDGRRDGPGEQPGRRRRAVPVRGRRRHVRLTGHVHRHETLEPAARS